MVPAIIKDLVPQAAFENVSAIEVAFYSPQVMFRNPEPNPMRIESPERIPGKESANLFAKATADSDGIKNEEAGFP